MALTALAALVCLSSGIANAHAPRENYIWINVEADHISGRFEVSVKDIKSKLGVDLGPMGDSRLTALQATAAQIQPFLDDNLVLSGDGDELPITFTHTDQSSGGDDFVQYWFRVDSIPTDNLLTIENTVFLTPEYIKQDRLHRSLVVFSYDVRSDKNYGDENATLVFSPRKTVQTLNLLEPGQILQWTDFLYQGILHIAYGLDHVLFIMMLLLTTVLVRQQDQWHAIPDFKSALWKTLKIVTLFTIAHSITLSLAALDLVQVNSVIVEAIIALSIVAIAMNNIFPRFSSHAWVLIFLFGLFHGLGFASVMGDLQFRNVYIERILILFNVGVEVGQFIIVLVLFPILYLIRKRGFYVPWVVRPLSIAAACIALYWVAERTGMLG